MRCESHFKSSFGNVKAFNLKKLKLSLTPSPQWPQAALRLGAAATAGRFLRQSLGRTVFGLDSFESIPETSRSSVETCTWPICQEEAQCSLGANLSGASRLLLNCPSGRQVSSSH